MIYYRSKSTKSIAKVISARRWVTTKVYAGELFTARELRQMFRGYDKPYFVIDKQFIECEIKKTETYKIAGVRFSYNDVRKVETEYLKGENNNE